MLDMLTSDEFLKSFKKVPRAAISLFIKNNKGVLLARRNITPEKGKWHLPGSFILKGEKQEDCIRRVFKKELGFNGNFKSKLINVFEDLDKDPRGHILDIVYKLELENDIDPNTTHETAEVKYFSKLPKDIGFNHRCILKKLGCE